MMKQIDKILVENGDVFDGNREQFMNCFFTNASNEEIKSWCIFHDWKLTINGEVIIN